MVGTMASSTMARSLNGRFPTLPVMPPLLLESIGISGHRMAVDHMVWSGVVVRVLPSLLQELPV